MLATLQNTMGTLGQSDTTQTCPLKALFAALAIAVFGVGASACGEARPRAHASASTATGAATSTTVTAAIQASTNADSDKDNDIGAPGDDITNHRAVEFGQDASASDRRAVTALIKRYYAIALAGDGTKACSMLYSPIAESVVNDYASPPGQPAGPPYMHGARTCPDAMRLLFEHFHRQLAVETPRLKVTRVRLEEHHGVAILNFGPSLPEREIAIGREGRIWKMQALLDGELP
jgi:hypothetical protein